MKKNSLVLINIIISLILILGLIGSAFISHQTYKGVIEDDIENISKLTSSNIYAEINGELTKPLFVAQTMSSDSFLKNWLYQEEQGISDSAQMQNYLNSYQEKYQYDAVYTISAYSSTYFYFDGVNKIVSPENEHDDWYYDFVSSNLPIRLNIDTDETNKNELTVFVDCRIEAEDGTFLGVTGVGVKMSRLQTMLEEYEKEYDLQAILMDPFGEIVVSTDSSQIEHINLFEDEVIATFQNAILQNKETTEIHWYPDSVTRHCIISRYVQNLDWYLIVQKDTQPLRISFEELLKKDVFLIAVMLFLLLGLMTLVIHWYNRYLFQILNTDKLTGLPNQAAFKAVFKKQKSSKTLFLFDIDRFKKINDSDGHLEGNRVLAQVAEITKRYLAEQGLCARWGGDEFIGVYNGNQQETIELLQTIQKTIAEECCYSKGSVTLSIGVTSIDPYRSLEELTKQADEALYKAKAAGGNRIMK